MNKVLVLGGGGFIGSNIARYLLDRGDCHVTVADLNCPRDWEDVFSDPSYSSRLRLAIGDYATKDAFDRLGGGFDQVYMMSAIVGVNRTLESPHDVMYTNTYLTMRTLDWIGENPIKKLLFASSSENYAGTSDIFGVPIPTPETVPLCISDVSHSRFTYAMTKMHGYECIVVRYQNIIGPNMGFRHAIPHIVQRFSEGHESPFKIYGYNQTRAFCFISDAVAGTVGAMESSRSGGEIYHIGNDQEITIELLTREIGALMHYGGPYEPAMTYPGSVERRCPDIRKCQDHFGYKPLVDWKIAVAQTVNWYRDYFAKGLRPTTGGFAPPENFL